MSKRNRNKKAASDMAIAGIKFIADPKKEDSDEPSGKIYIFRHRKARRAQARLDGLNWRDMSEHDRLQQ